MGPEKINLSTICFIVFCLCAIPLSLLGQNVDNLHIERVQGDGLTNDFITCITQGKNGFMWFGTREGLFRYDGYNFKEFRNLPGDSTTLANNEIETLYPEHNNLWVGSRSGLSCIDVNTLKVKNVGHNFLMINGILLKNDSIFWVATPTGFYTFNKNNFHWSGVPGFGKDIPIGSITSDYAGHLYLTTLNGFYCYTIATGNYKYYHLNIPTYPKLEKNGTFAVSRSWLDEQGELWMGTWGAGFVRFNTKTGKVDVWSHQTDNLHILPYKIIVALLPDELGNIWMANKEGGLTIFKPSTNKFVNYPVEWSGDTGVPGAVISLFRDKSGIMWIGTENGICKYDPHHVRLSKTDFLLKTATRLIPAHVSPITMLKQNDNQFWMGMYDGLYLFDKKTGILHDNNDLLKLPNHLSLAVFNILHGANGVIWISAKNLLIKVTENPNGIFKAETYTSPSIKSTIYNLYIDKENRIWLGTHSNGVFRFDALTKKFMSYQFNIGSPGLKTNEIRAFCELSPNDLLIGGSHTGLILLHANTGQYEKVDWKNVAGIDADMSINTIYKRDCEIWIGTEFNGLLQTNSRFKTPVIETVSDGLPSMDINVITSDTKNNLWLLTNAGVVECQANGKKITIYNKKDGIANLNELNTLIVDMNGSITFASKGSMYNFNPSLIIKNITPPEVLITSLKVFDKDYDIPKGQTIRLNYNQNYFSFEYVALNYTQSKLNRYAYKMDGLDNKWTDAATRRYVSYANLQEGTYTFNVKASNNEGVWNNIPARLVIIINPPFWHRWWFYTLIVVMAISIIYAIYAYNINQLKIRLQMRDKIARDLHDDIGSTLSGINIFSKIALQKIHPDQPGLDLIEKISERSQKTLDALSDIVWSINTRNDSMDNFLMKANEYLSVLEVQSIAFDFKVDEDIKQLKIGMALRKELYLIFKEAICNASKYAECSFIHINLSRHKDACILSVSDNGKGFNIHKVTSGNGIYNMHQRAKKMSADLHIESEENKGTTIILKFRITRSR